MSHSPVRLTITYVHDYSISYLYNLLCNLLSVASLSFIHQPLAVSLTIILE